MTLYQQILTKNDCYKAGRTIVPKGVCVHSTGANNPRVARYVPGNDILGWNTGNNDWDRPGLTKCVHAFIGKIADGSIATVQTLPWNWRGWHAGGAANNTHISFEICEDGLQDASYFNAVYREAVELTAYLCKEYGLDPLADGVVICHQEGYRRGVASNHADVLHWFPIHGKSMDDFRADVAKTMKGEDEEVTQEQFNAMMDTWLSERAKLPASDWAQGYIAAAVKSGVMTNTGTDAKPAIDNPQGFVKREELAVVASQLLGST